MIAVIVMYKKHTLQKKLRKRNEIWFRAQQLAAGVSPLPLPRPATEHQQSIANKITNQMLLVKNATLDVFPQKQ